MEFLERDLPLAISVPKVPALLTEADKKAPEILGEQTGVPQRIVPNESAGGDTPKVLRLPKSLSLASCFSA
jgi:hypothetical protein